jgi:hypothetical protein
MKAFKVEFRIWLINYILAPFSWSRWTDIKTFQYGYGGYLLQGRMNKKTNAKIFRITEMKHSFVTTETTCEIEQLDKCGLIDSQVKFNS